MNKIYDKITWHNNTTPALNEDNLNAMSEAIDGLDDRIIDLVNIVIQMADVTMLPEGSTPYVTNTGTNMMPVFHLYVPVGTHGTDGVDGVDGVSPAVTITNITDGHRVTITDKDHPSGQNFDVPNGEDGVSPTVTITSITDGHKVTITDRDHPSGQNFNVTDGEDGVSPDIEITNITGGHRVTITDLDHPSGQSFDVMNGDGAGDMLTADYDSSNIVANAGGIPDYVASNPANLMENDGSNAASAVRFSGSFTVGRRQGTVGSQSTAEGEYCTASGDNSHAEGAFNTASGLCAHAEGGSFNVASGLFSHAEGTNSTASGRDAHAEGEYCTASGDYSHAEGGNTTASGDYSHTSGYYTEAAEDCQTVVGKYNASAPHALFVVGNGTGTNAKSNAFEVWENGDVTFDGGTRFQMRRLQKSATLSTSSTTDVSFGDVTQGKYINNDAVLSVYTDTFGINPIDMYVSGYYCHVIFPKVDTAVTIDVVLEIAGTMSQIIS